MSLSVKFFGGGDLFKKLLSRFGRKPPHIIINRVRSIPLFDTFHLVKPIFAYELVKLAVTSVHHVSSLISVPRLSVEGLYVTFKKEQFTLVFGSTFFA